jgi:hypothetical protein
VARQSSDETMSDLRRSSASLGLSPEVTTPLIITDLETLRNLSKSRPFRSRVPIIIQLPELSSQDAEALSARINGYRNECGCSLGAKSMAVGFLIALALLMALYGGFTSNFLLRLPFAFLFAFVCAGAGKSIGIFLARSRLQLELNQLHPSSRFVD